MAKTITTTHDLNICKTIIVCSAIYLRFIIFLMKTYAIPDDSLWIRWYRLRLYLPDSLIIYVVVFLFRVCSPFIQTSYYIYKDISGPTQTVETISTRRKYHDTINSTNHHSINHSRKYIDGWTCHKSPQILVRFFSNWILQLYSTLFFVDWMLYRRSSLIISMLFYVDFCNVVCIFDDDSIIF